MIPCAEPTAHLEQRPENACVKWAVPELRDVALKGSWADIDSVAGWVAGEANHAGCP
jgi:hypothetical protein